MPSSLRVRAMSSIPLPTSANSKIRPYDGSIALIGFQLRTPLGHMDKLSLEIGYTKCQRILKNIEVK